jgi:hypothetical protein
MKIFALVTLGAHGIPQTCLDGVSSALPLTIVRSE